jgi:YD repeat-containing protein
MKGYKAINKNENYEVDHIYSSVNYSQLLQYCKDINDVLSYWEYDQDTIILEIEDLGVSNDIDDYTETTKFKIVRVIHPNEYNTLFTYYTFDENYNMISYTTPDGFSASWTYDNNHNKISYKNSLGYKETWEYDSNNTLIKNTVGNITN